MSLAEAALTAIRNHPDLKIAQAQIDQAQAAVRIASAPFYPSLRGTNSFSYSEAQNAGVGGQNVVRPGGVRNYNVGIAASQLLTDFGRTQSSVDAAAQNKLAAEWQKGDAVQTLLLRVSESYFTVLRTHLDVEINADNVRNAEVQVGRARGFFEAGTRAKIEVTRAEADLATAQVGLIKAQNDKQKAMAAFLTSLGGNATGEVSLQVSRLQPPPWSRDEAITKAKEARPDLMAAFARVKAAEARLRNAEAQYYPSFNASYSYAWSAPTYIPTPYNWGLGVTMSVPLFNEPTLGAGVQSAEAQRVQAEGNQELLALQIQLQAVESWINLQESRARLDAAQSAVKFNEENYRLASERYNVGVGSSLEVSDAQRLLVQARSQEVQARFDVQVAIARLYRQAGSLTLEALTSAAEK
jgi:outer membrane protein TolC